jgi:outer membrane protein
MNGFQGRQETSGRRPRGITAWMLASALATHVATAQQPAPSDSARRLTLGDAVRVALKSHVAVRAGQEQVALNRGLLLTASAPFDAQLRSAVGRGRDFALAPTERAGEFASQAIDNVSYSVSLARQFRSGLIITPEFAVSQKDIAGPVVTNSGSARFTALLPLRRDRFGGSYTLAFERGAQLTLDASDESLRHAMAQAVLDAAVSYWNYRAAAVRLQIHQASEERAARMLDETQRLVAADERTAADATQARANLAQKRVNRIGAEQAVIEAREQVGLAMALTPPEIAALALPGTDFPRAVIDTSGVPEVIDADSLVRDALARRADVRAATLNERSFSEQLAGARRDLRPRLDLVMSLGYIGIAQGNGVQRFFSPLYENVPGLTSSVSLRYELPSANTFAKGRELQTQALYEQQRIIREDLMRRVASSIGVATDALRNARLSARQADEAVALSRRAVQSELRRFRLGTSTLFDVIQAEDAQTNAELSQVNSRRSYAVAIANLRFQAGALVEGTLRAPVASEERLTMPPR